MDGGKNTRPKGTSKCLRPSRTEGLFALPYSLGQQQIYRMTSGARRTGAARGTRGTTTWQGKRKSLLNRLRAKVATRNSPEFARNQPTDRSRSVGKKGGRLTQFSVGEINVSL